MVDRTKIAKYIADIERQLDDLLKLQVADADVFNRQENFERTKAIKYTLLVTIEDIIHIATHLVAALGFTKPKNASEAILILGEEQVIPESFAKQIVGMVNFRNKLAHEYLPDEFEAERLFENLQRTEDFRTFSRHIIEFLTRFEQNSIS